MQSFFNTKAYVCKSDFKIYKLESIFYTKPYIRRFSNTAQTNGGLLTNCLWQQQHTNHTTTKTQNMTTMVPPGRWLPEAPILKVSAIAVRPRRCNFIDKTNHFFILLTIFQQSAAQRACGLKVSFVCYSLCFFCAAASKQCALTLAIRRLFFFRCRSSPHHVLTWFWMRGGNAMVAMFSGRYRYCALVECIVA
jgi:hypothetical protein